MHRNFSYKDIVNVFNASKNNTNSKLSSGAETKPAVVVETASPETLRAWRNDWKKWLKFTKTTCLELERYANLPLGDNLRTPLPANPILIRDFIQYHGGGVDEKQLYSLKSYKPATLARIISTISKAHELLGFNGSNNPCLDPIVKASLEACWSKNRSQDMAFPIQWSYIKEFLQMKRPAEDLLKNTPNNKDLHIDFAKRLKTELQWVRAQALLLVAYSTMLGREDLVKIKIENLRLGDDEGLVVLPCVKGGGTGTRYLTKLTVVYLRRWLEKSKLESGFVFCKIQKSGEARLRKKSLRGTHSSSGFEKYGKQISSTEVNRVFKSIMALIGAEDTIVSQVSGLSCRAGAIIDQRDFGSTLTEIIKDGGWKSSVMVERYIRKSERRDGGMAKMSKDQKI